MFDKSWNKGLVDVVEFFVKPRVAKSLFYIQCDSEFGLVSFPDHFLLCGEKWSGNETKFGLYPGFGMINPSLQVY